ncbi:MAG: 5-amino-6-(D-ribitylamino)uracil--L-tyrosine 4-hydroxyphenyl transferase CofH, partial [Xanthobacteraceae bacterium]|nr:5-amino-6-(D-ribitylamino)uracil--L-tyrosine 4-hydroxyphenyl transferase CofH [Xanthobacteraceae bacterium]
DSCHYCTFAWQPRRSEPPYMTPARVLAVARAGAAAGCTEALFTLGDKPELRYPVARSALAALGYATTLEYLRAMAKLVIDETGLLPHLNPGVMTREDMAMLRPVAASMGLMLETASPRLSERGGVHFGSPDKDPAVRLAMIEQAGELAIPFTTGLLIGIGETRRERIEAMLALRAIDDGHIQEVIIQPFRAKPGTRMAKSPDAGNDDLLWTLAVARLVFGSTMSIQTPPNLAPRLIAQAIDAGIDDWGGISPVTPDFVNPEAPWPHVEALAEELARHRRVLVPRLPLYPRFMSDKARWLDKALHTAVLRASDAQGMARADDWAPGQAEVPPRDVPKPAIGSAGPSLDRILAKTEGASPLSPAEIESLFAARGAAFDHVCAAADDVRARIVGDTVTYVVNRNINYTNVCSYRCAFCAFSKGKSADHLRGPAYDLDHDEIARRVAEAWERGATEVCLQGGIHPDYTGETYLAILRTVKQAAPAMHIHAFSPLEVQHGATTLGVPLRQFLDRLREAGLGSLPGTAAEILDDEVRAVICPDKLTTAEWLEVIETAHRVGLPTTATIMFGHVEGPAHWARHLVAIRELQARAGGFTEFVPLPFVHMEAPIYSKGAARRGPTFREAVLMHAVARLVLHPLIKHIQVSWVKMGLDGARACLKSGADDLGGTLMNESISRAAGASHGQELGPAAMEALIASMGRAPAQRTTLYAAPAPERRGLAKAAAPLLPVIQTPARRVANGRALPSV